MSDDHLGIEFYKDYLGNNNSKLKVQLQDTVGYVKGIIGNQLIVKLENGKNRNIKLSNRGKCNVKPFLRLIEDLTDDELIYVFNLERYVGILEIRRSKGNIIIKCETCPTSNGSNEILKHILGSGITCFHTVVNINTISNRLAEYNTNLKAKKYINNNTAIQLVV